MTTNTPGRVHTLGTLRASDGAGIVRLEDRFDTDVDDLWSALTDPSRLARWLGEVDGDLHQGGEFRARFFASGWEGNCRVEVCEPPRRVLLLTESEGEPDGVFEVTLTADGEHTVLVVEDRGVPLDHIASYGAGDQIHLEDLAAIPRRPRPLQPADKVARTAAFLRAHGRRSQLTRRQARPPQRQHPCRVEGGLRSSSRANVAVRHHGGPAREKAKR